MKVKIFSDMQRSRKFISHIFFHRKLLEEIYQQNEGVKKKKDNMGTGKKSGSKCRTQGKKLIGNIWFRMVQRTEIPKEHYLRIKKVRIC